MTVAELIQWLQAKPMDLEVGVVPGDHTPHWVGDIKPKVVKAYKIFDKRLKDGEFIIALWDHRMVQVPPAIETKAVLLYDDGDEFPSCGE